jgi:hypothetical protein
LSREAVVVRADAVAQEVAAEVAVVHAVMIVSAASLHKN